MGIQKYKNGIDGTVFLYNSLCYPTKLQAKLASVKSTLCD